MGAVEGYGFALQAYCLEGFDTPGLHQFLYPGSLMVRTLAFQVGNTGSIPVQDAKFMRAVNGVRLAFQAGTEDFDHPSPLQM